MLINLPAQNLYNYCFFQDTFFLATGIGLLLGVKPERLRR